MFLVYLRTPALGVRSIRQLGCRRCHASARSSVRRLPSVIVSAPPRGGYRGAQAATPAPTTSHLPPRRPLIRSGSIWLPVALRTCHASHRRLEQMPVGAHLNVCNKTRRHSAAIRLLMGTPVELNAGPDFTLGRHRPSYSSHHGRAHLGVRCAPSPKSTRPVGFLDRRKKCRASDHLETAAPRLNSVRRTPECDGIALWPLMHVR